MSLTLVAVMLALTLLVQPQLSNSSVAFAQDRGQSTQNQKNDGTRVLRGTAVKDYVQKLRLKDKALNRALKDMERWGKLPNWESSAIIKEVPASKKETASVKFQAASFTQDQYWSDGNGNEMVVITAYGSESNWDGTIHTYDASTGESSTYNGIVDELVSNDPETSDVVDELYYPPDGGDPYREGGSSCGGDTKYQIDQQVSDSPCFAILSPANKDASGKGKIVNASAGSNTKPAAGFVGWFKRYFRCIKRCMALATQSCFQRYGNNFRSFFVCLAIGGTAASITCAFNTNACS
jgi:hypothetical protein